MPRTSPPTERVVATMALLAERPDASLSLAELTRRLGVNKSTGHAILTSLAAAGWAWAFAAMAHDDHADRHCRRRRDHGDGHPAALRHLFNQMLGQLYHCLQTGQLYHPHKAFTAHTHRAETTNAA